VGNYALMVVTVCVVVVDVDVMAKDLHEDIVEVTLHQVGVGCRFGHAMRVVGHHVGLRQHAPLQLVLVTLRSKEMGKDGWRWW
jgi:hypothetical protein